MKKIMMIFFVINFVLITTTFMYAAVQQDPKAVDQASLGMYSSLPLLAKYFAASIAIAGATISSGIAIGRIGAAAMGAVSEKPETGGTAMILAALAEGVCLWGIAGAFIILVMGG